MNTGGSTMFAVVYAGVYNIDLSLHIRGPDSNNYTGSVAIGIQLVKNTTVISRSKRLYYIPPVATGATNRDLTISYNYMMSFAASDTLRINALVADYADIDANLDLGTTTYSNVYPSAVLTISQVA